MKKIIVIALCLAALLCACGKEEPAPATEPAQAAAPAQTEAAPATEAATEAPTEAATEAATEAPTEEAAPSAKELAQSCVDKSVEDLFALIGEPQDSEYTPSCLGDGEDGFLYYDGFTVYTYKDAEGETVSLVE